MIGNMNTTVKQPFHDFMVERKWLVNVMGFGEEKSALYGVYVAAILVCFMYQVSMTAYGMTMYQLEQTLFVDASHTLVITIFAIWGLTTRILTDAALEKLRCVIKAGFYLYQDEGLLEEQLSMKEKVVSDVRSKSGDFIGVWFMTGITLCLFFPISQLFLVTEERYEQVVDISNPYLSAFFYMPFNTRDAKGFAFAYFIMLVFYFYLVGAGMVMNEIYISCIMQLRAQLQILNYSIRHIHRRAVIMYHRTNNIPLKDMSLDDVYENSTYQKCLSRCLRSNVEHHQVLLKFNEEFLKFSGSILLLMFNVASIAFASNLYLIMQNPSLNTSIKCFITLVADQTYTLYLCVFGELIMQESSSLFETLYSIPWFYYSKNFNQTLRLFMCCTMKPMRVRALLLDLTASLETYGSFMSVMYKILSMWKQSDSIS